MMTYTHKTYRLGTTAIAAVLALSSTQLLAQEAPSTDTPTAEAPATTVTPAPVADAPAPSADPLAPTAEPAAPADSNQASAESAETKAAPKAVVKKSVEKTKRTSEHSATRAGEPVAPAPKPAIEPSESSSPLESMKPAEIASIPDAKPVEKAKLDEAVPLAGGAGAVILALAGAGMAVRRRKRRHGEEGLDQEWQDESAIADEPMAEPAWDPPVREPAAMAAVETTQANDLPEDFDTSKFGPHVQAAYRGPTPENPSLSLRKRLKIAGELDRRERESGQIAEAARPVPAAPLVKPVVATAKAPQSVSFSYSGTPTQMKWPEKQH
ncbi:MAG TPA: hypothetical protein VFH89_12990 [Sphingomicrobium sp.]|nr:hypothetical protein [Sphingomicrobium sp.]